jgi:hypothetical protein
MVLSKNAMFGKVLVRKVLGFKRVHVTISLSWELTWLHIGECCLPHLGIVLFYHNNFGRATASQFFNDNCIRIT